MCHNKCFCRAGMTRPLFYSLFIFVWMVISLYISASSSQPLANQNESESAEEVEQWSFKEKRPFCNAFAGIVLNPIVLLVIYTKYFRLKMFRGMFIYFSWRVYRINCNSSIELLLQTMNRHEVLCFHPNNF